MLILILILIPTHIKHTSRSRTLSIEFYSCRYDIEFYGSTYLRVPMHKIFIRYKLQSETER